MIEERDCLWLYWCPGLAPERWREECQLVDGRFSLFRSFAEAPFLGFRGLVARSGSEYHVTVAAEMDFYPKHQPWVFVTPKILGARENGKLSVDVAWSAEISRFADVVESVIRHIEVEMIGTTRSRVSFFMNRFRKLGFIDYHAGDELQVHSSLLNIVLHD